ncbi:MAG TPA: MMPL family transporter [Acidimicrobiales bacterium]|nr:MMPL family transporter [Acidimicrobiales bacterium]
MPRPAVPPELHAPRRGTSFLGWLAGATLRHRKWVIGAWAVAFVVGAFAASHVSSRLTVDFSLPGQPGYETAQKILATYHNGGDSTPSILVVSAPRGGNVVDQESEVAAAFGELRQEMPQLRVVDYGVTGDRAFVTDNGDATFALLFEPPLKSFGTDTVAEQAQALVTRALPGDRVGLTGLDQLEAGSSSSGPGVFTETLIGAAGALVVLAFVFASFLAFVPLLVAAVSILTTLLVVLGLTYLTEVSFIVEFLVALVGLGIAIDYSLLLVTRWREERAKGISNDDAVVRAVQTAGRSVVLSGVTVAIGLMALVVLPVPGLRSTGIGGMLIPLVSILVVITLLPAVLGGIGPRVDWPRVRKEAHASRAWSAWAARVTKHRFLAAPVALGVLAIAVLPVFGLKVGETSVSAFSRTGPARTAYETLVQGGVPGGVLTPLEVLTTKQAGPVVLADVKAAPGISAAVLPSGRSGSVGGTSDIIAIPSQETVNDTTLAPVRAVETRLNHVPGALGVTGEGPIEQDYSHAVFGHFPEMFAVIAVLTFLLLARAFRSVVLAGKAVLLNLLSLAATFGLLTWFWQEGHGSEAIFGVPATGAITFWVPLMVFAFLFGLSMDYEVFILTRVREEYDRTGNTNQAVVEGLGRTGRLVTCAALILFLAFTSLASAPDTDIKVLATGLGAGIVLDATLIRGFLVPALVAALGRWNWWLPQPVSKLLLLKPKPEIIPSDGRAVEPV